MDYIDSNVQPVADLLHLPMDQTKFVVCAITSYGLSFFLTKLTDTKTRYLYGLLFGFLFGLFVFGAGIVHSLISSSIVYLLVKNLRGADTPRIVFAVSFGYLLLGHLYRYYTDYLGWRLDFTTPQMIITLKLISFAYDVNDARIVEQKKKLGEKLDQQNLRCIHKIPGPIEFYSYVYFYGGFFVGPLYDFNEYKEFMERSMFAKNGYKAPAVPMKVMMEKVGLLLLCIWSVLFLKPLVPLSYLYEDEFLYEKSFVYRILYIQVCFIAVRSTYYTSWIMIEISLLLCGFNYIEENGKEKWNRLTNINIIPWELSQNIHSSIANWNIRVAAWLRRYVYFRVLGSGYSPFYGKLSTFVISAVWHGFYPGYYLFFISLAIYGEIEQIIRKTFRTFFFNMDGTPNYPLKYAYDFITFFGTNLPLNYLAAAFLVLSLTDSLKVWSSLYFYGHVLSLMIFVAYKLKLLPSRKVAPEKRQPAKPALIAASHS